jgi:APA family basic amino acid/polyamine antiporter
MILYVAVNVAYFYVLSPEELAGLPEASSVAFEVVMRFAGASAAAVMAAALVLSAFGTLHTTMLTSPRLPYALARRGMLPRALIAISVRGVPITAVLGMAAWAIVLALSGTYDILTDMYIFVLWIFYGMSGVALFLLRRAHPEAPRPYRVWGYPVVPTLFLVATAYLLVNTLVATPGRALAGLGLIAAGVPAYTYFTRRGGDDTGAWLGLDED